MDGAAIQQQLLGERRLARVRVTDDGERPPTADEGFELGIDVQHCVPTIREKACANGTSATRREREIYRVSRPRAVGEAGGGTGIAFPWIMFSFLPSRSPGADRRSRTMPLTCRMAIVIAVFASQACGGDGTAGDGMTREVWGFTAFWDSASAQSVARHGSSLDAVITTWIALDTAGGLPNVLFL